jgi:hypothetical protein
VAEYLLNLAEAARRLRMGESTLRQKLYKGLGPIGIKLPGSDRWKFRPADLDAYERAGELTPEALTSASNPSPIGSSEPIERSDAPVAAAVVPRAPTRRPPARKPRR